MTELRLIELFPSVQGETSWTGLSTTFVRLAACNLRCTWCDTPYSFVRGTPYSLETILARIEEFGCRHVCITGGEPLLQKNVYFLMQTLADRNYCISLETGGSLSTEQVNPRVKVILDIKCPGSGMHLKNEWKNVSRLNPHDEVKFVLAHREDYLYAKEVCEKYNLFTRDLPVLLSPVHGVLNPQILVKWMLEDKIPVRLNLQIHKFIWTPETRAV